MSWGIYLTIISDGDQYRLLQEVAKIHRSGLRDRRWRPLRALIKAQLIVAALSMQEWLRSHPIFVATSGIKLQEEQ
jgi:hypothetical protein